MVAIAIIYCRTENVAVTSSKCADQKTELSKWLTFWNKHKTHGWKCTYFQMFWTLPLLLVVTNTTNIISVETYILHKYQHNNTNSLVDYLTHSLGAQVDAVVVQAVDVPGQNSNSMWLQVFFIGFSFVTDRRTWRGCRFWESLCKI